MFSKYLTVDKDLNEVEDRIAQIAGSYPHLCTRIFLLNPTKNEDHGGAKNGPCSMLWIEPVATAKATPWSRKPKPHNRGVLFFGGVHGDEWGGAEICLNFAEQLLDAYKNGGDLRFQVPGHPPKTFSASHVSAVVERLSIFVFPLVNPDGRALKQRQNYVRVDISRNFDFLWSNPNTGGSTIIGNKTYRGTSAGSEDETKNLVDLIDRFPIITRIVDIHTNTYTGPIILYQWAHDLSQTKDPKMNFTAAVANGWTVGRIIDKPKQVAYKEYIAPRDLDSMTKTAVNMRDAIKSVRGTDFYVGPGTDYDPSQKYGISGVPTDYFFSRHVKDSSYPTVYGWLIEYGEIRNDSLLNPEFSEDPEKSEMAHIIQEINAGMMELCIQSIIYGWLIEKWLTVISLISDFWRRIFRNRQR